MPRSNAGSRFAHNLRFLLLGVACVLPLALGIAAEPKNATPKTDAPKSDQKSDLPVIEPDKANDFVGKDCIVEFKVLSANLKNEKSPCFLNSKGNFKDKDNFQVVIMAKHLPKFQEAKIEDPSLHFAGKTIRVRGMVKIYKEKPEIEVSSPEQITLVEEKPAKTVEPPAKAAKPAKAAAK